MSPEDKEMLKKAAISLGCKFKTERDLNALLRIWNPLESKEDAFDLMVKHMPIDVGYYTREDYEKAGQDGCKATMRAIVRKVAERVSELSDEYLNGTNT